MSDHVTTHHQPLVEQPRIRFGIVAWRDPGPRGSGQSRIEHYFLPRGQRSMNEFVCQDAQQQPIGGNKKRDRSHNGAEAVTQQPRDAKRLCPVVEEPMPQPINVSGDDLSDVAEVSEVVEVVEVSQLEQLAEVEQLDEAQLRAFNAVISGGKNVFITGAGGNGKSFTIRHIVEELRKRGRRVAVTSSTGISAVNLNLQATTVHKFLGFGDTGDKAVAFYVKKLTSWAAMEPHRLAMRSLDVLIIDEVSMLSADFLDKASAILSSVRRTPPSVPWGGVQVVFSGDFAQLRPVSRRGEPVKELAFRAEVAWIAANIETHTLECPHRQSKDSEYAELLCRARYGRMRTEDHLLLEERVFESAADVPDELQGAMKIFSRNDRADSENMRQLVRLDPTTKRRFTSRSSVTLTTRAEKAISKRRVPGPKKQEARDKIVTGANIWLEKSMRAGECIEMRRGARVILLANLDQKLGLVNGSAGTVIGYGDDRDPETNEVLGDGSRYPRVRFDIDGQERTIGPYEWRFDTDPEWEGTYTQVPFMLAYACTIHRVQGLTVDRVLADLSGSSIFDSGMGYVVISRVRARRNIGFYDYSRNAVYADPTVLEFYGAE